jgi:hypothetical protein
LKPGLARRVDPEPGWPRPGTSPGLNKNLPGSWSDETQVNPEPSRLGQTSGDLFLFLFFIDFLELKQLCCSLLSFIYLITQLQFSQSFISCHEFQRCKFSKLYLRLCLFLSSTMMSSKLNMVFWCLLYSRTVVPTSKQTFLFLVMN